MGARAQLWNGCRRGAFARDYQFGAGVEPVEFVPEPERATFQGFRRSNGKVGTRNYIGILTSVNCSATVARYIAEAVERSGMLDDYPPRSMALYPSSTPQAAACRERARASIFFRAPNGVMQPIPPRRCPDGWPGLRSLPIGRMKQKYGVAEDETFQTLTIQGRGGTRKAIEQGVERVRAMLPIAARAERETIPASELILALQCGGSDGYSGITANPALGVAVDMLVRQGGTAILSETSESMAPSICSPAAPPIVP